MQSSLVVTLFFFDFILKTTNNWARRGADRVRPSQVRSGALLMPGQIQLVYKFGDCLLSPVEKQLWRDGKVVPLPPKVFDTLLLLVESHSRLVEKDEFLRRVWKDCSVEEVALAHCISHLRKALSDGGVKRRFIETVPKRGYRFIAAVEVTRSVSDDFPPLVRVAVLPFENLSGGPDREYLAHGFTEETIAALGQIDPERLSVVGRTTVMTYEGTSKTLSDIARELNAEFLIESSIRLEERQLRILSRLVRGHDQVQVWSATYDSRPNSLLAFQQELGIAIAGQIRLHLSTERLVTALARRQTQSAEAFDQYLRGRYFWNQLSPATTRRALEYYTEATVLDPGYALAWSGLADASAASPINGDAPPLEVWQRAREAAARAVRSEPKLAEAQTSMGMVGFFLDWDWVAAEKAFRKAILLDPEYCLAHRTLGILLSHSNKHQEARFAVSRARTLEPLHAAHHALSAQVAFNARDYPAAVHFARQAIVIDSEFWVGHLQLAQALHQEGDSDLALNTLQTAWRLSGGNTKVISLRGFTLARLGRIQEALDILETLKALSHQRYVPPYSIALVLAGLGERDSTFEFLEKALTAHDVHVIFLPVDPKWDDFRNDLRFISVLNRCDFDGTRKAQLDEAGLPA